jgi:uncharacterized membrane protein
MTLARCLIFIALAVAVYIIFEARQAGYFGSFIGLIIILASVSVWLYLDRKILSKSRESDQAD